MTLLARLLSIFIVMPIWWYLLYKILERVNASELMWFLFWIYIPAALMWAIITAITERTELRKK